ncbi:hypothetical protein WG66_011180, partial [Moniliophthora roreri]
MRIALSTTTIRTDESVSDQLGALSMISSGKEGKSRTRDEFTQSSQDFRVYDTKLAAEGQKEELPSCTEQIVKEIIKLNDTGRTAGEDASNEDEDSLKRVSKLLGAEFDLSHLIAAIRRRASMNKFLFSLPGCTMTAQVIG